MKSFLERYGMGLAVAFLILVSYAIAQTVQTIDEQQKFIKGYGYPQVAQATQFYQVDSTDANNIYMRWSGTADKTFIKKVNTNGSVVTNLKAFDTWANKATAVYTPIND